MRLKTGILGITIISLAGQLLTNGKVMATVGGPIYISDIAYNPLSELVYYQINDRGGQGCPPIIHGIDLTNNKDAEVKSCGEVIEEFSESSYENGLEKYRQYISDFYKELTYLASVDLQKNKININVVSLGEHFEYGEKYWTEFRATVSQNDKEISTIDFRGCNKNQPHVFEGYMVPDSDILALLISNKGDCFEGGYIQESLHVVSGIKYFDTKAVRYYKEASATEPNEGNVTVRANLEEVLDITPLTPMESIQNKLKLIGVFAATCFLIFFLGTVLGFIVGKRYIKQK